MSEIFWQELQSHEAAQTGVFSLVHHAHSAATKLLNNSIVGDGLANHGLRTAHLRSAVTASQFSHSVYCRKSRSSAGRRDAGFGMTSI